MGLQDCPVQLISVEDLWHTSSDMYSVDDKDDVVELREVPQSSKGAPLPFAVSDEHKVLLAYIVENVPDGWDGTWVRVVTPDSADETIACVQFNHYCSYQFGRPNDEAFSGHPLASRGLHPYAAFEIKSSSWIRQLERMNSVHDYHKPERYERLKHYVFAFHDSTFECVAEGFAIALHQGSLKSLLPEIENLLGW